MDFLVAATYQSAQITAQQASVGARNDDICVRFSAVTANATLKFLNILNLINQNVIMLCSIYMLFNVSI